jgi:HK97 family phage major capsid protein
MDLSEIKKLLEEQGAAWAEFRQKQFDPLRAAVIELEKGNQRMRVLGGGSAAYDSPAHSKELEAALRDFLRGDDRGLKGMMVGSDPGGGYTVIPALSNVMTRVEMDFSPLRQLARIVPIEQADAFEEVVDKDTAAASWVGETAARPATSAPQMAKLRIPVHEIYAMPEATQSLIDDSQFDIVSWLSEKVGQKFGASEGAAFVTGTGVGQPRGFLTYPTAATADASRDWGTFEHVLSGTNGGFGADPAGAEKLIDVVQTLKAGYRRGAVWLLNKTTAGEVRKLKDTAGRFVWVDSLQPSTPPNLLGYPVVEAEDMPDISTGSLSIAFGNFRRGYTIVDRVGVRLLVDPFTNKPYVRLYTYKRVGGDVNDFHAIKLLKFSA